MHSDQAEQAGRPTSLCPAPGVRMAMSETLYSKALTEYEHFCPLTFVFLWDRFLGKNMTSSLPQICVREKLLLNILHGH